MHDNVVTKLRIAMLQRCAALTRFKQRGQFPADLVSARDGTRLNRERSTSDCHCREPLRLSGVAAVSELRDAMERSEISESLNADEISTMQIMSWGWERRYQPE